MATKSLPTARYPSNLPNNGNLISEDLDNGRQWAQFADATLTAIYAASGAVTVTATGNFATWPADGYVENQTTEEVLRYTAKTNDTLTIVAAGRARWSTSAVAGAIGEVMKYIEPNIPGALENQQVAEILALATELGTEPKGPYSDVKTRLAAHDGPNNLCLNPGFETVLPGTHTDASQRVQGIATLNLPVPAWRAKSTHAAGDITCSQDTTVVNGASRASLKIVATDISGTPVVQQDWSGVGTGQFLGNKAYAVRSRVLNFALDIKMSTATPNAIRLFITTDGTGGTTTVSVYQQANTDWQRRLVSVTVPADATSIQFGVQINHGTPDYRIDNAMAVATDVALTALPFQPRNPCSVNGERLDSSTNLQYTTPADTNWHVSGDGTADLDYDFNVNRPAWATDFDYFMQVRLANTLGQIRPNGDTNSYGQQFAHDSGNGCMLFGQCPLGADGQIQFAVAVTTLDLYLTPKRWRGLDL